jgi:hypothetical protein
MRFSGKNCGGIVILGLAFGLAGALSGCSDAGGKSESKPIESNILKKLSRANTAQQQGDEAKAKALARFKKK